METYVYAADTSIVSKIVDQFNNKTNEWMKVAIGYAKRLFLLCLTLEIAYLGIRAAIGGSEIGETLKNFVMAVLTAGFFIAVIDNYQEWSQMIIKGLAMVANEMAGSGASKVSSDNPFKVGLEMAAILWDKGASWDVAIAIAAFASSMIILICFILITAQVILIKCESMVALLAACIILGFGSTTFFREYAINVMKYVVAIAFKLFVLELILNIGFSFVNELQASSSEEFVFSDAAIAIAVSMILLSLVSYLPNVVAGLIQASSVNGGGALLQAARTVGMAAGGAAMVAKGAAAVGGGTYSAGKMLKGANALANAAGASGIGKVASMGKTMWNAGSEAKSANAGTTMGSIVKEKVAALKAKQG